MALGTLGTNANTSLVALTITPGVTAAADLASIQMGISSDALVGANAPAQAYGGGVLTTATTNSDTSLASIGSMTRIQPGMFVMGAGIVPGTTVVSVNVGGSSAVLSQATTASAAGVRLIFVPHSNPGAVNFEGQLFIPRRGVLQLLPGDVVALDNTGWPILVSAASIAYAGSVWHKV